jgi:hypothetical protein
VNDDVAFITYRFKIPLGESRTIPEGSLIHRSVVTRMRNPINRYAPKNLPERYKVVD